MYRLNNLIYNRTLKQVKHKVFYTKTESEQVRVH